MNPNNFPGKTLLVALALGVCAVAPHAAQAAVPGQDQFKGTITAFDGKYSLHVERKNGDVDAVEMHQGTIINPTGLRLRPGMRVTVVGNDTNGVFQAFEIDTPYHVTYENGGYGGFGYGPGFGYGGPFGFYPGFAGGPFFGGGGFFL